MAKRRRAWSCTRKRGAPMSIPAYQALMRPFQPEYAGKMHSCLAVLGDLAREEGENPSS